MIKASQRLTRVVGRTVSAAAREFQRLSRTKKILLAAIFLLALVVLWKVDVPSISTLRHWADQTGWWFLPAYWCAYVLITQFPVPRTILTLASGVLFGPLAGILIALSATTASAAISLTVVRNLLRDWISPRLTHPAVETINRRLSQRGWLAVGSLRMIAGVPFSVLNYTAALTQVGLIHFTAATFLGSAPGTIATVLLGDALTGHANPWLLAVTVGMACLGALGLLFDARLPVKSAE